MAEGAFRHEYKHLINIFDAAALRARLGAVAKPDPNAGAQGRYRIRSLYFDNLEDKALREKLDGVNHREKFRIRFYNGNTDVIHLEKKSKHGDLCAKQAAPISREACEALLAGDIRPLCRSGDPLLLELYAKMRYEGLRPRTLVDYLREAYVYSPGNVRVTLDWDVRSGVRCIDLFNLSAPTLRATEGGALLLEVKFDAFLPEVIQKAVQLDSRRAAAFSKYAACRVYG